MYCNLGKSQVFPLVFRVSSQPKYLKSSRRFKPQSFSNEVYLKPLESSSEGQLSFFSNGVCSNSSEYVHRAKPRNISSRVYGNAQKDNDIIKSTILSSGSHFHNPLRSPSVVRKKNFSSGYSQKDGESETRGGKTLPWIAAYKGKEGRGSYKGSTGKASQSSWEESANKLISKNGTKGFDKDAESRNQLDEIVESHRSVSVEREESGVVENAEDEIVVDPRWDRIKSRYRRITDRDVGYERPEVRKWSKQENWGKKTWKEASESTSPKMSGEGIYGVGPVLAALSAGRREFYTLFVQEGLDLSSNNRKKKDKKGFEKILRIAEKIGLKKIEVSKHDLNMIVENRPHQGLVLDATPLDLVSIRELDPLLVEGETGPLWVALDEVTDPQNLGAIIRSSYFFGAAGVVLCAKNSAPLSGVVSKASAGSLELMELRSCKNMMQFLSSSAENGWRVLGGSVSSRAIPLNEVPAGAPTILVLGSEGKGLRPLVERSCTDLVRIPGNIPLDVPALVGEDEKADESIHLSTEEFRSFMAVESLNVSVAAGVLLHHLIGYNNDNNNGYNIDDEEAIAPPESLSSA